MALDVSLRSVHLCVIDEHGELTAETKLSSEVTDFIAYLDALVLGISVVGFITALTYKPGVDDPYRFKHSRTVAAPSDQCLQRLVSDQ
ncbi:MAG: hypothetical protein OEU84_07120 [Xanthomonadales bacterium]|nr:hypothetical protein [Xanthomonadales bacterium]MDH4019356.1 hypothetical protein [Xanthomonadales bacterium]